ncbi:MAG: carboxypeptidase regulatory-like domain-containing protein [Candidatus Thermoplasmatota archaeon]|nr:carboxypeptidase regulatory-like domain-containing protein [Candidatus Thermoplasmatota archaeon]
MVFTPTIQSLNMEQSLPYKFQIPTTIDVNSEKTDDGEYWGLIIAVAEYADDPSQNRPLMLKESKELYDTLLEYDCWTKDHIKMITAEDATSLGIIKGFQWLDDHEDENDISLIYYTTHGYPLGFDIPPYDEEDGTDEALVSFWGFACDTGFIWDDELNVLLGNLESEGVCLIVDSCFAGGFNDPPFTSHRFTSQTSKEALLSWNEDFGQELQGQGRVVVMASREDQVSYSGVFAPFVVDAIRGFGDANNDGGISAEEIFAYAKPRCHWQTPTIYDNYPGDLNIIPISSTKNEGIKRSEESISKSYQTKNKISSQSASVCGNITSDDTHEPIPQAGIYYFGIDDTGEYYRNTTQSDLNGFYQITIPPGQFMIKEVNVPGYYSASSEVYEIKEDETICIDLSLKPVPSGNSTIKGYITNQKDNQPVEQATVFVRWSNNQGDHYINATTTDAEGYYALNVASGRIEMNVEADGYEPFEVDRFQINNYETKWINVSIYELPDENAKVCGFVTEKETGNPLSDFDIQFDWQDGTGHIYDNDTKTNEEGFFEFRVAPGEIYIKCWEYGYEYTILPRHDAKEDATTWVNFTIPKQKIHLDIAKPLRAIYLGEERLRPFVQTVLIGSLTVEIFPHNFWYNEVIVDKIEIYIDNSLMKTLQEQPFEWTLPGNIHGSHSLTAKAYLEDTLVATDQLNFLKI